MEKLEIVKDRGEAALNSEFWIFLGGLLAAFGGEMSSDYFQNTPP